MPRRVVVGVGVDVVETRRFERLVRRGPRGVWTHWYTDAEADACVQHAHPGLAAATRFAVKEATYKAVNACFPGPVRWRDVEVLGREPAWHVVLHGVVEEQAVAAGVGQLQVSTCTSDGRVVAVVIATEDGPAEAPTTSRRHG